MATGHAPPLRRRGSQGAYQPMSDAKLRVGFIGIGAMGTPISHNLLKAGFPLTVYDRFPAQTEAFAALGVPVASSCADLARKSDVVFTMIGQVAEGLEAVVWAAARRRRSRR